MLHRALDCEPETTETLEEVLDEIDVRDADWRIGNYQILEEIGRGGMGVIYRARQRHSLRIVALKRILSFHADSRETLARFRREAEAAASLDHPNILPIYEVSESDDGLPFFSMKFAAGGSLQNAARNIRDHPRQIVALVAKSARAVQHAHNHGIIHRDLKPGNILLDGCGEPMVSDFGLARWLDTSSDLTRTLTIFGTPGYIAPEQADGAAKSLTPAADIYSIGCVLFDLFTGRTPFLGEHALAVIKQASENPAPKLRTLTPLADRDVETICAKCLERDPQARYHSTGELADDLERWLEGRPIIARPVSPPIRIWRWSKRNPKLASSVGAAAVLGMLLLAVALPMASSWFSTKPLLPIFEKSIAVLPFENLSDDKQNAYFTDGVQDEILTDLARVADLKVISRTSVMQYRDITKRSVREIAHQLGVAHIVEGTVQRVGDRVKISAQLIDARTDTHEWGTTLDRSLADVFAVQSEVSLNIVNQLKVKLSSAEEAAIKTKPTQDLMAYDRFVRARSLIDSTGFSSQPDQGLIEAARFLEEAVNRDPTFLRAYCELARVHDTFYIYGDDHTPGRVAMADRAIEKAMAINPDAGEVHLAKGYHLYCAYLNYDAARRELAIASSLLPNEPRCFELAGFMDRRAGEWDASVKAFLKALELDPRSIHLRISLSQTYEHMRRFPEKAKVLDQAIAIAPDDFSSRIARAWVDLEWRADPKPLRTAIEQAIAKDPTVAAQVAQGWFYVAVCERNWKAARQAMAATSQDVCRTENVAFPPIWCEGFIDRAQGNTAAARKAFLIARAECEKIVREQPNFGEALSVLGLTEAALGDKQKAIEHGKRAVEFVPPSKDAVNGPLLIEYLSLIYSWTGEKDRAVAELKRAAALPSPMSYGDLRLHPFWDELRGDPRFEQIVASMAPK
jgi:serine/threonine-protein kinase